MNKYFVNIIFFNFLASILCQETALLTGGFNGYEGGRDGCELLNQACLIPSLPVVSNDTDTGGSNRADREDHITHVTEDGLVLACGGEAGDGTDDLSCVQLDVAGSTWVPHSVLSAPRIKATSVALPGVGLYIIGGFKQLTTELLPLGADNWIPGPVLPGDDETSYYGICSVLVTPTKFMVIGGDGEGMFGGTRIQVYDSETDEWDLWSDLSQNIWGHSCTRTGDQVVVAGGVSLSFNIIPTTYILDLNTREEKVVGDLIGARAWFGMATLSDRVLAFGGMSPLKDQFNDIQELDMETQEWKLTDETLATTRGISSFASAVVYINDVCQP